MKKYILMIILGAFISTCTACSNSTENSSKTDNSTISTQEFVDDTAPTKPSISVEEAQKIADNGMSSVHNKDALSIIQNTTYGEVLKIASKGEIKDTSDEGCAKWLEEFWEKDKYYHDMRACYPFQLFVTHNESNSDNYFDYECKNPKPMTEAEVNGHNNILQYMNSMSNEELSVPKIIDGYSFDIVYTNGRESPDYKAYVLKTEGSDTYKLDLFYTQYAYAASSWIIMNEYSKTE